MICWSDYTGMHCERSVKLGLFMSRVDMLIWEDATIVKQI